MKKNFFFYLMPSVARSILGIFLVVPITTYYLDPKDFGVVAILGVIAGLISPLSSTGVVWVFSAHFYKVSQEGRKELIFNILFLDFLLKLSWGAVFAVAGSFVLPMLVKEYEIVYLFYFHLALIGVLLNGLWPIISYTIVLQERGGTHAFLEMGELTVGIITTILCLVVFGLSIVTLFLSPLASGAFISLVGLWTIRKQVVAKIRKRWLFEIVKRGMPTIPVNLFEVISNSVDRYFIQRWINLSQLGIYAHSMSYRQIFTMGSKALTRSFVPEVLQTFTDKREPESLRHTLTIWYGLLGVAGLFISLFSYEIIDILTHGKFVAAAPLVPIWFLLILIHSFGISYTQFLLLLKKNAFMVYSSTGIGALFIGIGAFFIYNFGIIGAATALVLYNGTIHLVRRVYAGRLHCKNIADGSFITIVSLILSIYLINSVVDINFSVRIIGFFVCSGLISHWFGLFRVFKNSYLRLIE